MIYRNSFFMILLVAVLISGCAENNDITSAVEQLPQVQQFLEEHPDATITVTYWSEEEIAEIQDELSQEFGKTVTPKPMYKAVVSSGDIVSITWIDAETQTVLYSYTENTSSDLDSNSVEDSNKTETHDDVEDGDDYLENESEVEDDHLESENEDDYSESEDEEEYEYEHEEDYSESEDEKEYEVGNESDSNEK
ncbi:hypothetical protein RE474_09730 [Methanolobus sediminis]|uniref:Uncharacterized protein n=1 Tax=Methanolobus sediminis TaxID=3072978 RepID=A0AA51UIZ3_9EURY|nr:hypothetical protein [Methanolobus sediminis]WMW24369.1 hypothetical protein RE474_09730 [Methanolobus sediminis]